VEVQVVRQRRQKWLAVEAPGDNEPLRARVRKVEGAHAPLVEEEYHSLTALEPEAEIFNQGRGGAEHVAGLGRTNLQRNKLPLRRVDLIFEREQVGAQLALAGVERHIDRSAGAAVFEQRVQLIVRGHVHGVHPFDCEVSSASRRYVTSWSPPLI